jgi:hypothetical protein
MMATALGIAALLQAPGKAAADVSVPCSGDTAACGYLKLDQKGTDYRSGAHFVLSYTLPSGHARQSMTLTLSIAGTAAEF